jgi:NRPS condensation-like uncharacterized protein
MTTAPLNVLDELYLHLDREQEPFSVHLEVAVEGRIDEARLREAIRVAAGRHPLARARLRPARGTDRRYHWEIAGELDEVPLATQECADDVALGRVRERLLSTTQPLDDAPPFGVVLVHHPAGDTVLLNLRHAAGDGMSALRLMASVLRAYAGHDDPLPPVDPLAVRDIGEIVGTRSLGARLVRAPALLEQAGRVTSTHARIEPDGGGEGGGYGFELLRFGPEELTAVLAHRRDGATVNDVLLGALAVTVRAWNEQHERYPEPVRVMMPVNLRPPEWRLEVMGNYASYVTVDVGSEDGLAAAVAAAAAHTRRIKAQNVAGLVVDLLEGPTAALPTAVKRRFQDLIGLTGNRWVDTTVLSNLGRLEPIGRLDDEAGAVRSIWFSPPGRMPLGASFGAATYEDTLFLTLRYCHALFDAAAARAFGALLRGVLTEAPEGSR